MFIISEISPQFGADLDVAEQMILQSKLGGANAAKIQLYPADLFTENPSDYLISRELTFEDFERLKNYGDRVGLPVFATAFTFDMLDWCVELGQKYYKVAARMHHESPELVKKIISCGETVFVSVPHDLDPKELKKATNCIFLYCTAQYPTLLEDMTFPDFRKSIFTGLSDHSLGVSAALYAASHGCQYLEKHFTLSYAMQRSMEKAHLGAMDQEQLNLISTLSKELSLYGE